MMTSTASKLQTGKSALLLGATGAVGTKLLAQLLASDEWTRVGEYGRRVTGTSKEPGQAKLEQKVIDFERLDEAGLKDGRWDVVFVTLGTTRAQAGGAAQFEKIDREYVVRACEAAKTDDPTHKQRIVYLSCMGADPNGLTLPEVCPLSDRAVDAQTPTLACICRSKGLTERALAQLGYADTIIFHPGFLKGAQRPDSRRIFESMLGVVTGVASHFSPNVEIEIPLLVKAMAKAGTLGSSGIPADVGATRVDVNADTNAWFTVLTNKAAALLGGK